METQKTPKFLDEELPQDLRLGAERLLGAVADLPLRYAPFFGRLAALWQVPEPLVLRELARARHRACWNASLLRGLETFDVNLDDGAPGARAHLLHLAPGLRFPKHRHRGQESVLVLEGAYADSSGRTASAGDLQCMPAGSEHELRILGDRPCVAAVLERGVRFDWFGFLSALSG